MPALLPSGTSSAGAPKPAPSSIGEKQTIPARHGTATFVPRGHTIKIINTYGRQIVDTWVFALGPPPPVDEEVEEEGQIEEAEQEEAEVEVAEKAMVEGEVDEEKGDEAGEKNREEKDKVREEKDGGEKNGEEKNGFDDNGSWHDAGAEAEQIRKTADNAAEQAKEMTDDAARKAEDTAGDAGGEVKDAEEQTQDSAEKVAEKGTDATGETTKDGAKAAEKVTGKVDSSTKRTGWSAYIPSMRGRGKQAAQSTQETGAEAAKAAAYKKEEAESKVGEAAVATTDDATGKTKSAAKPSGWSAYIPSISTQRTKPKKEKTREQKEKEKLGWSAYLPSGKGFSVYLPSKSQLSAFAASHERDPTKSYAEQLYDFSKTPVGAAGLSGISSVATGSGYAGSLYAAYSAYSTAEARRAADAPPMEYMSMQHTRVSINRLVPRVGDTLTTNLRAPIVTVTEDTSPGAHDTLIPACDPQRYKELGVEKWEEHGSCAENLVFALQQINQKAGLKGRKAIGSDVTVYTAPAPLNLFMNVPWRDDGEIELTAPRGKRGDAVTLRAERDVVVVMSACPQDVIPVNGKKPMVAHFVVESPSEEDRKKAAERDAEAQRIIEKARARTEGKLKTAQKSAQTAPTPKPKSTPSKLAPAPSKPTPQRTPSAPKTPVAAKAQAKPGQPAASSPAAAKTPVKTPAKTPAKKQSVQAGTPPVSRKPSTPAASSAARTAALPSPVRNTSQPGKKKPKKLERRNTPQNGTPQMGW